MASDVLVPLNDFVDRDGVDTGAYFPGLAELWVDNHGNRYGLPKDFDTIALVMNADHVAGAGVTRCGLRSSRVEPRRRRLVRRAHSSSLSVDANGNTGDSADFDPGNVEVYGLGLEGNFGAFGQTTFSAFAAIRPGSSSWT